MSRRRRTIHANEAEVQRAVLAYLRVDSRVAWANRMNTGAMRTPDTETAKGRFVRFAFPGCADILGQLRDGRFLAVECKHPITGSLTVEQRAFLDRVEHFHGVAGVARSVEDVQALLDAASPLRRSEPTTEDSTT